MLEKIPTLCLLKFFGQKKIEEGSKNEIYRIAGAVVYYGYDFENNFLNYVQKFMTNVCEYGNVVQKGSIGRNKTLNTKRQHVCIPSLGFSIKQNKNNNA